MELSTYSPSDVTITLAGLHTVVGYADGTFVNIVKDSQPFASVRAMDGSMARMYTEDTGYKVELTLMQSSSTNNVLTMLYNIDKATRMGKIPLFVKDGRGQTNFLAATAWIEKIPDVSFGSTLTTRTWVFGCSDAILTIGGNGSTDVIEDSLLAASTTLPVLKQFGIF